MYEPPAGAVRKSRPRWVLWLLLALAAAFVVLAAIGFPLLPLPSRSSGEHPFHVFGVAFDAWRRHSGWRYTSDSWIYWAGAVGFVLAAAVAMARRGTFTIRYAIIAVPMAALLAVGPLAQRLVGLRASNFDPDPSFGFSPVVSALVVPGLLVVIYLSIRLRGALRRGTRSA